VTHEEAGRAHVTRRSLAADLRGLAVPRGRPVLVHASLSRLGLVEGGPAAVAGALRDVIGHDGTIVVPTTTDANSRTSRAYRELTKGMSALGRYRFRRRMRGFDAAITPSSAGRIAEYVRTCEGAVRSAHPQTSFAALGPYAGDLMRNHAPDCHLGEESPLARLYAAGAGILMLGTGYAACTAFHLAEYRYVPDPPRRRYSCVVVRGGRSRWWHYEDVVLDDSDFPALGEALDATPLVRRGTVGEADARLIPLARAVDFAVDWFATRR
jgi:aminoglycoside 3-N-acetyltransferase